MKGKTVSQDELAQLLFEMMRLVKRQWNADPKASSILQMETLRFIRESEQPDMGGVAEFLRIAPPSATALINTLVKDGLLLRKADPSDRRRVTLSLSAKGERLYADMATCRAEAFARVFAPLSDRDRTELARILSTIITKSS